MSLKSIKLPKIKDPKRKPPQLHKVIEEKQRINTLKRKGLSTDEKYLEKQKKKEILAREEEITTEIFLSVNEQLGPPYYVLMDTNFIHFSMTKKIDIVDGLMKCLLAQAIPIITDCVMAELEKLGKKFKLSLKIAHDERFMRMSCSHEGNYADDCLVQRVTNERCYLVGTCDKDLKNRLRKIPGVPLTTVGHHKYQVERLPSRL